MRFLTKKPGFRATLAAALILAALGAALLPALGRLGRDRSAELVQPQRDGWNGVLVVWLCETFQPGRGSFALWLTNGIKQFQKANEGVYIKLETVSPAALIRVIEEGGALPDALVCGGGLITPGQAAELFAPTTGGTASPRFVAAASTEDGSFGIPLAAGAYTVLYSAQRLADAGIDGTPADGGALGSLVKTYSRGKREYISQAIDCAATGSMWYGGALMSFFADAELAGIVPESVCALPAATVWADFVLDGDSAAYLCTQKEVYRIRQLEAGGGAFEWRAEMRPCGYSDQMLALYVMGEEASGKSDWQERARVAESFAAHMQGQERQGALADVGAFSVNRSDLYRDGTAMRAMEAGLYQDGLVMPDMFRLTDVLKDTATGERACTTAAERLRFEAETLEKLRAIY